MIRLDSVCRRRERSGAVTGWYPLASYDPRMRIDETSQRQVSVYLRFSTILHALCTLGPTFANAAFISVRRVSSHHTETPPCLESALPAAIN